MSIEAGSDGEGREIAFGPPPLGEPAPSPERESMWALTFGPATGNKTSVIFAWGEDHQYHEQLNVASATAREKFARGSIQAASLESGHFEDEAARIIAAIAKHSAMAAATPATPPGGATPERPRISNHNLGSTLGHAEIDAQLSALAPGWPKRVGNHLFVADPRHVPEFLDSPTRLLSWMDELAMVDWAVGPTMITEGRYFAHLLRHAEPHEGIDVMLHEPPIPGIYYMTPRLPEASESAGALDEFVDFFRPETPQDRELIKAMVMTPAWGGPNGGRPAFLVTSPQGARKKGTGRGKSTLVQRVAELHGGAVTLDQGTSIEGLKTRLLSPAASTRRVLVLDNVKTHKLSWGALEGLITEQTISGRENYVGEGRRPNILTTFITLNGARLSVDLARRVVTIVMGMPEARASWEADLSQFLAERRWHVLADIRSILAGDPPGLNSRLNYAPWEAAVLAHVADPGACQGLILERREQIDADEDERELVLGMFIGRLEERGHDPEAAHVSIRKSEVAGWLSDAMRERFSTAAATNHIKMLDIGQLSERHTKAGGTWEWRGKRAGAGGPKPINSPGSAGHRPVPTRTE